MRHRAATWTLILVGALSGIELGGGIYEGLVVFPAWSSSPPSTFALIQESGGLMLGAFWLPLHVILTLILIPALVLNWKMPRRRNLVLVGFRGYLLMRVSTFAYFLPELTAFLAIPPEDSPSPELTARVALWGALSVIRVGAIAVLTVTLLRAIATPTTGRMSLEARPEV